MSRKKRNVVLLILLLILVLLVGIIIGYLLNRQRKAIEAKEQINKSETVEQNIEDYDAQGYMTIPTEYGNLYYPEQWSEYLVTDESKEGDSLIVLFSAQINGENYSMFQVSIGESEDTEVGELTDDTGTTRTVYMKVEELEENSNLSANEQQRLYAMQEDLNYVIDHLK